MAEIQRDVSGKMSRLAQILPKILGKLEQVQYPGELRAKLWHSLKRPVFSCGLTCSSTGAPSTPLSIQLTHLVEKQPSCAVFFHGKI